MAMPTTFLPMNKLLAKVLHLKLILKPIDLLSLGRLNRLMNFFKISYSVKPYGPPTITLASFGGNVLFVYLSLGFLKYITFHDEYQQVPDLKGIPLINLPQIAADKNLRYEIIDSSKFTPNLTTAKRYRALSPAPDDSVKKNRKIYVTLKPFGLPENQCPRRGSNNAKECRSHIDVGWVYHRGDQLQKRHREGHGFGNALQRSAS